MHPEEPGRESDCFRCGGPARARRWSQRCRARVTCWWARSAGVPRSTLPMPPGSRDILGQHQPEIVFNAAAFTDVDGAEDQPAASFRANAEGPGVLAEALRQARRAAAALFDRLRLRRREPARPTTSWRPPRRNRCTRAANARARCGCWRLHPAAQVLRVGCLYGHGGRNFPSTLLRRLRAGETIRADNERRVSPTWAGEVAGLSARLGAQQRAWGSSTAPPRADTTWAAYARFLADAAADLRRPDRAGGGHRALKLKAAAPAPVHPGQPSAGRGGPRSPCRRGLNMRAATWLRGGAEPRAVG